MCHLKILFPLIFLLFNFLIPTTSERSPRHWIPRTNWEDHNNWEGFSSNGNCSTNIFSFPESMMDISVLSWPSTFTGQQIILPANGHFVLQQGLSTLSDNGGLQKCTRPREIKYIRTTRANWFDPFNWKVAKEGAKGLSAVPHVERVPCQFDTVKLSARSTFGISIPKNVSIGKMFLGEKSLTYTDVAILMTTDTGKLQFQKSPDTHFNLTSSECRDSDDSCICQNYSPETKRTICTLAVNRCPVSHEECPNPLLPHGFCCSVCGLHIKITHTGSLKLDPVNKKLKEMIGTINLDFHVSRHKEKGAHVIIIPQKHDEVDSAINVLGGFIPFLKAQPGVLSVSWTGSWEHDGPGNSDKFSKDSSYGGASITFIIIFLILLIAAAFCFLYKRRNGNYPQLSSISAFLPTNFPTVSIPTIQMPSGLSSRINLPGRRTHAGGRTPLTFARFTNERVSTINIQREATSPSSSTSTLERGETVDDDASQRIDSSALKVAEGKIIEVSSSQNQGFADVSYDLIGGISSPDSIGKEEGFEMINKEVVKEEVPPPKPSRLLEQDAPPSETVKQPEEEEPVYSEVLDAITRNNASSTLLIPEDNDEE